MLLCYADVADAGVCILSVRCVAAIAANLLTACHPTAVLALLTVLALNHGRVLAVQENARVAVVLALPARNLRSARRFSLLVACDLIFCVARQLITQG